MKKIFNYDLNKFIEHEKLYNISEDESLYLYIKELSKKTEYRNMFSRIMAFDRSLEADDIINEIYIRQLNRNKKCQNEYVYSTFSFKYELVNLYNHYSHMGRKNITYNNTEISEEHVSSEIKSDLCFQDIIKDFDEEDRLILTLYFRDNYTFDEINKIGLKKIKTRAGVHFRVNILLNKLKENMI